MAYIGKVPTAVPLTGADIQDGTVQLADLSATGTKDATTFLRGDNTFASAGGTNTPAFSAYRNGSNQTIANNTNVVIQFNSESFDTDDCYDTSTYKFTPNVAGKYFLNSMLRFNGGGDNVLYEMYIKKNSSNYKLFRHEGASNDPFSIGISAIVEANGSTDYFEISFFQASSSVQLTPSSESAVFEGYKIIE